MRFNGIPDALVARDALFFCKCYQAIQLTFIKPKIDTWARFSILTHLQLKTWRVGVELVALQVFLHPAIVRSHLSLSLASTTVW
jgi:hypothetical protein